MYFKSGIIFLFLMSYCRTQSLTNETNIEEDDLDAQMNRTETQNTTRGSSYDGENRELEYYPDEARGGDGYISSFFESFWPFRAHQRPSLSEPSFSPSHLLEVSDSESKKEEFIRDFCKGEFDGDLEDFKKSLDYYKIPFNSDLYALQSQLCSDLLKKTTSPSTTTTTRKPYFNERSIITKRPPHREFLVQSGFSYNSNSDNNRDYYPNVKSSSINPREPLQQDNRPYFISSDRRSDSDRSLNNNRYRRINLNRKSPPKPAIMNDNDVKFYPATVQDFLEAPGRPFIKKLPGFELRQKLGTTLSFPHFPRRVAPEQQITPRFLTKTPATTTSTITTTRIFSKFIAYDANPDILRKRVVIKPRKHLNHQHGTRRNRVRIPVRKNFYNDAKKARPIITQKGVINVSTVMNYKPKNHHEIINSDIQLTPSIKQFGSSPNIRMNNYSNSMFHSSTPSSTSTTKTITYTTSTPMIFSSTSSPITRTTPTAPMEIDPTVFGHHEVLHEISAPTSFIIPDEFVGSFGAKQEVRSEPFLPEEALLLQNEIFDDYGTSTTENYSNEETTTVRKDFIDNKIDSTTYRVISAEDFQFLPSSILPSLEFRPESLDKDKDYYDDIENVIGDLSDVASTSPVEDIKPKSKGSAQKLAYILIGVCCGLSVLCLIVVVVSLAYKKERNFMGEEYRRNLFRRIMNGYLSHGRTRFSSGSSHSSIHEKTSTSRLTGATNSAENQTDEQPSHKLGSWFNGKLHNIQTLDRKKKEKVFPTNVYLDNLNDLTRLSDNELKKTQKSDVDEDDDNFSVEELFESRSKVVSNASSSSPSMSIKSAKKSIKEEESDKVDTPSKETHTPDEPEKSEKKDTSGKDEILLSENNDRLI
ncbi:uncharacterized protein [Lepeophtheirus salmonis]|uniref:uncharacterized protein n=1 Tax=Lepeophtheirus salmonis TaxID=72036 RepID=UPI003AF33509